MIFSLQQYMNHESFVFMDSDGFNLCTVSSPINIDARGYYQTINNHFVGFLCYLGELILIIDNNKYKIANDNIVILYLPSPSPVMQVFSKGKILIEINCETATSLSTIFYSEDEEDSNFCLWLANVTISNERMEIFKEAWCK